MRWSLQPDHGAIRAVSVLALAALNVAGPARAQLTCVTTSEGRVCTVSQAITNGAVVSVQTQRDLGLVTVGGGCSGTLVNRYWILTADHCTTTNGTIGGPSQDPSAMRITAAWSSEKPVPTRFVRNWNAGGLDIALIYLGAGDFGPVNIQILAQDPRGVGDTLVKYGQGLSVYASAGPPPVPASGSGTYRTATFIISAVTSTTVRLPVNASNQVGNGGDSGGPDILLGPNNISMGVASVQSTCTRTATVPRQPVSWAWTTAISGCNSAPIANARFDILQVIAEVPADLTTILYQELAPPLLPAPSPVFHPHPPIVLNPH